MNHRLLEDNKEKKNIKKKSKKVNDKKPNNNIFIKKYILFFSIPLIIFINIYLSEHSPKILDLIKRIEKLESTIQKLEKETIKKKIKIAFVSKHYFIGINKYINILGELLIKLGRYDVYLITEKELIASDYKYNKKIKRYVTKNYESLKNFDEENNIDIYILNNDISTNIDIYKSFEKKVIGFFHGVFLTSIFKNETNNYRFWKNNNKLDAFIQVLPDDYWVYKKIGFNTTIYIPYIDTFDKKNISSPLTYKNILMIRKDGIISGEKYGLYAMAEIVKEVPDARLTIIGTEPAENIKDLIKELKLQDKVVYTGPNFNITELYLNTSVFLFTSFSESCSMQLNEGKAYGLPIVAFNIDYCPYYRDGLIKIEMFDYISMAKESIKLLTNYQYRKRKSKEAILSLNNYETTDEKVEMWDNLFKTIINSTEDFNKFQKKLETIYYNEDVAKENLKKHYHFAQQLNEYFRCHSFEKFTTLEYLNNIEICKI